MKHALSKRAGKDRKLEEAVLQELTAAAILKNVEFRVLQSSNMVCRRQNN